MTKEIKIEEIVSYVQEKIENGDYKNLKEISPEMFWENDGIVVVGYDEQGRLKFIAMRKKPWGGFILDLRIGIPGKSLLSERGDSTRLSHIGFDVKLFYSNTVWDEIIVAGHYHEEKREIFYLPNEEEGSLIVVLEELNTGEIVSIKLCGRAAKILGQPYYMSILMDKEVLHNVAAAGPTDNVKLLVLADQPYNEKDNFRREEWTKK